MSRQTAYERKRNPRFRRWMADELTTQNDNDWHLGIRKHTQLALRGSVRSAEFLLRGVAREYVVAA